MKVRNGAISLPVRKKGRAKFFENYLPGTLTDLFLVFLSLLFTFLSAYNCIRIVTLSSTTLEALADGVLSRYVFDFEEPVVVKEYIIRRGDTLSAIARNLGTSVSTLVSLNNLSSQTLIPGRKLLYAEGDVLKYKRVGRFSAFDVGKRYGVHPYEVFVANGYRLFFENECLVPGVQLSWAQISEILGIGFLRPILGRFTSGFGYRLHPVLKVKRFHSGLDISAPYGSPVRASMSGIVQEVGYDEDGYGRYVVIKHSKSLQTLYGHLSKVLVTEGQRVSRGQVIGKVGDTGMTTGPHLHFEVIRGGRKINPRRYIIGIGR